MRSTTSKRVLVGGLVLLAAFCAAWSMANAGAHPAISQVAVGAMSDLTRGVDGSMPLSDAIDGILRCGTARQAGCAGVLFIWSPTMPLSREGIVEISRATEQLGIELAVVEASEIEARAAELFPSTGDGLEAQRGLSPEDSLTAAMIAGGVTLHQPSVVVHRSGDLVGSAILGYKTANAYRAMVEERIRSDAVIPIRPIGSLPVIDDSVEWTKDYSVSGRPGAYFRSVAGRQALAYEADGTVYLLNLRNGESSVAPGFIDFVPTPDGRLFVTPGRNRGGLEFYDANEVFEAAARGRGRRVDPIYVDPQLRDQYPSVGILGTEALGAGRRTVYRVLTSWFDRIVFRDYEVRRDAGGEAIVRPLSDRVSACPRVSIPILAPNGRELAGRDEASATTKIYRLGENGECQEIADLGLQTGKVAWSPDGGQVAFAVPRGAVRNGSGTLRVGREAGMAGIYLYERDRGVVDLIEGSGDAERLAFPDFVSPDSLVFLLSPEARRSAFRIVCCVGR